MPDDLNITIIQTELTWENVEQNLQHFEEKIAAVNETTSLIVLPEMFNTGFTMHTAQVAEQMNGKTMQWMAGGAKEKACVICGSLIIEEDWRYYNRLIWMRPDGTFEKYDKRHLFRMAGEDNYFAAGNERTVVELDGWRICLLVCYDLRFPVWSRNKGDYDCLIYVANWPERRVSAWKTLLRARAIENQCYVIGVNRIGNDGNEIYHSGDSAVIDPKGEMISHVAPDEDAMETISLSYADLADFREKFPVTLDADRFEIM